MSKRILIITDSISMPRTGIPYEKTWIYYFKKEFKEFDIIDRPMRGGTTNRLNLEGGGGIDLLELYRPDIVIIQMGFAECAPRLFKKSGIEHFFMNKIIPKRYLNNYIRFIKKRRVRMPECTYIHHSATEENIFQYIERCRKLDTKLIYIKIHRPNDLYIAKSPFIAQNVERFNKMLDKFAENSDYVKLADPIKAHHDINVLCVDELHINHDGHKLYYNEIASIIRQISF